MDCDCVSGDELFAEVAEELLEKKRQMLNKYQLLLLNDSMVRSHSSYQSLNAQQIFAIQIIICMSIGSASREKY